MKRKPVQMNYAVHFGAYLMEWLEENNVTLTDANNRTKNMYGITLTEIMASKESLSEDNAIILKNVTKIPQHVWENFDNQYRKDALRLNLL